MCCDSKEEVVESVFEDFEDNVGQPDYFKDRILLATTNEIVDELNDEMVNKIPGDLHDFASVDTVDNADATMFPQEF